MNLKTALLPLTLAVLAILAVPVILFTSKKMAAEQVRIAEG